ncbi:MAG: hypothetical protein AB1750_07130 [Chloroflexota bacterium]
MKKFARFLLIVGSIWMIVVCFFAYLALVHPGLSVKWKQEPLPPEPVASLKVGKAGEILAETQDGKLYEYGYHPGSPWLEVSEPSGVPSLGMYCHPAEAEYVSPPPGEVKLEISANCVYNESSVYLTFALLDNGEIWSWRREVYAYTLMAAVPLLFGGCAIGALILSVGAGLWLVQRKKRIA